MLKRILLIIPFLFYLSVSSSSVSAENWVHLTDVTDSYKIYIDSDNIIRDGDTATVWIKMVKDKNYFQIGQQRYHKINRTYSEIYGIVYAPDGKIIWRGTLDQKEHPITPGDFADITYNFIWKK